MTMESSIMAYEYLMAKQENCSLSSNIDHFYYGLPDVLQLRYYNCTLCRAYC